MHVFSRVFETIEKFAGRCYRGFLKLFKTLAARVLSGFKNTQLRLVFLNLIKHCCSCCKQYLKLKRNQSSGMRLYHYYLPGDKYFSQYFLVVSLLLNLDMGGIKLKLLG